MPFPPTPSNTASNTPTPSITPSITPTITPSLTPCPYVCCFPEGFTTQVAIISNPTLFGTNDILIGGNFGSATYQGESLANQHLLRIDACGNFKQKYPQPANIQGNTSNSGGFAQQSDGKVIIAGVRTVYRLNADFSVDTTFTSGFTNINVGILGVAVNSLDEILIVGNFGTAYTTSAGTVNYNTNIYKLSANGVPVASYSGRTLTWVSPNIEPFDNQVVEDANGNFMIYGFEGVNGDATYQGIVRFDNNFNLDTTFKAQGFPSSNNGRSVFTAYSLQSGKYLVGGAFLNYSGISNQDLLIRLNNNGSLDTSFVYGRPSGGAIQDIVVQSTGNIVLADGDQKVVRIIPNGATDSTWLTGTTTSPTVYQETSLLLFPNDQLLVGGSFNTYNSLNYPKLVKVDIDGALDMCPFVSPTPSPTTTKTQTPSITPTSTATPTIPVSPTQTQTPSPTPVACLCYYILNETASVLQYTYTPCGTGLPTTLSLTGGANTRVCSEVVPTGDPGMTIVPCVSITNCTDDSDCIGCSF